MARPSLREKLASSAVDTLHTHGFRGCSIQDITQAAGGPRGRFSIISKTRKIWLSMLYIDTWKVAGQTCFSRKASHRFNG